jgi:hypothetical protein
MTSEREKDLYHSVFRLYGALFHLLGSANYALEVAKVNKDETVIERLTPSIRIAKRALLLRKGRERKP